MWLTLIHLPSGTFRPKVMSLDVKRDTALRLAKRQMTCESEIRIDRRRDFRLRTRKSDPVMMFTRMLCPKYLPRPAEDSLCSEERHNWV